MFRGAHGGCKAAARCDAAAVSAAAKEPKARAEASAPALDVRDVSIAFGGMKAVDAMSLVVEAGELLGLIGPNGAGKSTLFNLVAGVLRPDAGTVRLAGHDVGREDASRRIGRGLARTFQIPRPFGGMSVLENMLVAPGGQVGEGLLANFLRSREVARQERQAVERARELLEFLQLSKLAGEDARILSGGQRKLLELGRALMSEPQVLLLDEPAAGVNPALLDFIIERIAEINRSGITVLLIEHNMEMVARLCPRVMVMAAGRRLAEGRTEEITRDPRVVEAYLGGAPA
ncbi:ABC transporter ATP-binding protein [Jiella endophytica]|uniref:ABC transporter ATP-binding protein n=1 Tax=Jiella endophytica TaxID=2558362 RepID=A0A4Y8RJG9_9HYPH|nr:ABC transporter ATP-binding protein [Jiella endophytica]